MSNLDNKNKNILVEKLLFSFYLLFFWFLNLWKLYLEFLLMES